MRCEIAQSALIEFYYQEVEAADHRSISAHLAGCPSCASEYRCLHADLAVVEESITCEPSPRLSLELRAAIMDATQLPWWRRAGDLFRLEIPMYQAALVAALGVVFWMGLAQPPVDTAPQTETVASEPREAPPMKSPAHQAVPGGYDAQGLMAIDHRVL